MKSKGFTLIELLAVIVILAIIALIATPIILNIIDNTKEQSVKRSIDHYMSAATAAIAAENLKDATGGVTPERCDVVTDEDGISWISCFLKDGTNIDDIKVEVDGEKPTSGEIYFSNGKITAIDVMMSDEKEYLKGEIYRKELEYLSIGDDIIEKGIEYEMNLLSISQNYYLKHEVENNIVTASYACITYEENGTRKDVCLRGGDSSYYESNQAILSSLRDYLSGDGCNDYGCEASNYELFAYSDGSVSTGDGFEDTVTCHVEVDGGRSYCMEI